MLRCYWVSGCHRTAYGTARIMRRRWRWRWWWRQSLVPFGRAAARSYKPVVRLSTGEVFVVFRPHGAFKWTFSRERRRTWRSQHLGTESASRGICVRPRASSLVSRLQLTWAAMAGAAHALSSSLTTVRFATCWFILLRCWNGRDGRFRPLTADLFGAATMDASREQRSWSATQVRATAATGLASSHLQPFARLLQRSKGSWGTSERR